MAAPYSRNVLHLPGELIKDPTDLSAAAPYGGTRLGMVRNLYFRPGIRHVTITAEEWGGAPVEVIYAGASPIFGVTLRELDNDALGAVFLDTATGSPSGDQVVHLRATTGRAGTQISEMKLLFVPRAVLRHPSILIRAALPVVTPETEIQLSMGKEVNVPVLFYARPDSTNRVASIGKLGDLSL